MNYVLLLGHNSAITQGVLALQWWGWCKKKIAISFDFTIRQFRNPGKAPPPLLGHRSDAGLPSQQWPRRCAESKVVYGRETLQVNGNFKETNTLIDETAIFGQSFPFSYPKPRTSWEVPIRQWNDDPFGRLWSAALEERMPLWHILGVTNYYWDKIRNIMHTPSPYSGTLFSGFCSMSVLDHCSITSHTYSSPLMRRCVVSWGVTLVA